MGSEIIRANFFKKRKKIFFIKPTLALQYKIKDHPGKFCCLKHFKEITLALNYMAFVLNYMTFVLNYMALMFIWYIRVISSFPSSHKNIKSLVWYSLCCLANEFFGLISVSLVFDSFS